MRVTTADMDAWSVADFKHIFQFKNPVLVFQDGKSSVAVCSDLEEARARGFLKDARKIDTDANRTLVYR